MFKILLKSKISSWGASIFGSSKKGKTRSKGAKIALLIVFVLLIALMMFSITSMFIGISLISLTINETYAMLTIASIVAIALCIIGSIFATKTQIFDSKDNEFLLSMPIQPKHIFLSRLVVLMLINYLLEALVMLPAIIIHAVVIGFSFLGAIFSIFVFLLIPFFTLSVSALCAWIVSLIASKVKNKTIVTTILSIVLMAVYFVICFYSGSLFGSEETTNISFSGLQNTTIFYWIASAMSDGNYVNFFVFLAICVVLGSTTYFLLDHFFINIITTHKGSPVIKYKSKVEKVNSLKTALLKKEVRRFFTSSAYILNAGIGNVFGIVLAIILATKASSLFALTSQIPEIIDYIPAGVSIISMFFFSMNIISAPSISLENNSLWILKCAPIKAKDILMAKVHAHTIISLPCALVATLILTISFKLSPLETVIVLLTNISLVLFTAYFGMLMGLKFPKFDWLNENVAVKQGFAVFGALLGGMLWSIILSAVIIILTIFVDFILGAVVAIALNMAICVAIYIYFSKKAENTFKNLKQ